MADCPHFSLDFSWSKMDLSLTPPSPLSLRVDYWASLCLSCPDMLWLPGSALTEAFSRRYSVHSYNVIALTCHQYSDARARSALNCAAALIWVPLKLLWVDFHPTSSLGPSWADFRVAWDLHSSRWSPQHKAPSWRWQGIFQIQNWHQDWLEAQ